MTERTPKEAFLKRWMGQPQLKKGGPKHTRKKNPKPTKAGKRYVVLVGGPHDGSKLRTVDVLPSGQPIEILDATAGWEAVDVDGNVFGRYGLRDDGRLWWGEIT